MVVVGLVVVVVEVIVVIEEGLFLRVGVASKLSGFEVDDVNMTDSTRTLEHPPLNNYHHNHQHTISNNIKTSALAHKRRNLDERKDRLVVELFGMELELIHLFHQPLPAVQCGAFVGEESD